MLFDYAHCCSHSHRHRHRHRHLRHTTPTNFGMTYVLRKYVLYMLCAWREQFRSAVVPNLLETIEKSKQNRKSYFKKIIEMTMNMHDYYDPRCAVLDTLKAMREQEETAYQNPF